MEFERKQIKLVTTAPPQPADDGRYAHWEPSDRQGDVSVGLTPYDVGQILATAAQGDPRDQARLSLEIEEKDGDIAQALQTRRGAVTGLAWSLEPADDSPRAAELAATLEAALRGCVGSPADDLVGLDGLLAALLGALLPGYACAEIVWQDGGAGIAGFSVLPAYQFTFLQSRRPLLWSTTAPQGVDFLAAHPNKFVWHVHTPRGGGDPARGGLVRPLAWLYAFKNLNLKDLLRYLEKYGMPFIAAKLDDSAFEKERTKIAYLVRNFGSDGGGVFTKATELTMLQPGTQSGDLYFRFLDYAERQITRLVLGQTLTSGGEKGGSFALGKVQNGVRKDLEIADARALAATLDQQLLVPLTRFHGGDAALALRPRWHFDTDEDVDQEQRSKVVLNLTQAGYRPTQAAIAEEFGYELEAAPAAVPAGSAGVPPAPGAGGPRAGGTPALPAVLSAVQGAAAGADTTALVEAAMREAYVGKAGAPPPVEQFLQPLVEEIDYVLAAPTDEAFKRRLAAVPARLPQLYQAMDSAALEELIARVIYTATAQGMAARAAALGAGARASRPPAGAR